MGRRAEARQGESSVSNGSKSTEPFFKGMANHWRLHFIKMRGREKREEFEVFYKKRRNE